MVAAYYPFGITDADIDEHFGPDPSHEDPVYQQYLETWKAEAEEMYGLFLENNDHCSFDEFLEDHGEPDNYETWREDYDEGRRLEALEAQYEIARDMEYD